MISIKDVFNEKNKEKNEIYKIKNEKINRA